MTWKRVPLLLLVLLPSTALAAGWAVAALPGSQAGSGDHCLVWSDPSDGGSTATWDGPVEDGKAEGDGTLVWRRNGAVSRRFQGRLHQGKKEGLGALEWRDGRRYRGGFHDDRMQGRGLFRGRDGSLYDGFWLEGRRVSDRAYQHYLARHRVDADVRDLRLAGIRLQSFYSKYESGLAKAQVTTPEGAPYRELTAPGLVVRLVAPWDAAAQEEWVVDSIRVTGGGARTGRGLGLGSSWEEIQTAYPGWPAICLDPSLVAFGWPPCLRFEADHPWGPVTDIVLGVLPEDHDERRSEE